MIREGWFKRVLIDLIVWVLAAALCFLWRWGSDKDTIAGYWALFAGLFVLWVVVGCIVQLYRSFKETWFWQSYVSLVLDAGILIGLCWWILPKMPWGLSPRVAMWTILLVGAFETVVILMEHYWKYATNMTVPVMNIEQRKNAVVTRPDAPKESTIG